MTGAPESLTAAPARPVLLRLSDTDPAPETDEPTADRRWASLDALPELEPTVSRLDVAGAMPAERRLQQCRSAGGPASITEEQARSLSTAVVRSVLEVLDGRRAARQLHTVLTSRALARLETALRTDSGLPIGTGVRLRTVHVCLPQPRAIEACAVFQSGARCSALAARLEPVGAHWKCTALQLG